MKRYKDTLVAKGSDLYEALAKKAITNEEAKDNKKNIEKIYAQTTDNYKKLYPADCREYLDTKQREHFESLKRL